MMMRLVVCVNQPVLVMAASAVAGLNDLEAFESFRVIPIKTGLDADVVVGGGWHCYVEFLHENRELRQGSAVF